MSSSRHSSPSRSRKQEPRRNERSYDRPQKTSKLFVTNIDSKYDEDELRKQLNEAFSKHGEIKEIVIKTKQGSNNSFAFVEFNNVEDANQALQELNRVDFLGKELKVEFGRGAKRRSNYDRGDRYDRGDYRDNRRGGYNRRQRSFSNDRRDRGSRSRSGRRQRRSRSRSGGRRKQRDYRRDRDYDRRKHDGSRSGSPRRNDRYEKRRYSREKSFDRNDR